MNISSLVGSRAVRLVGIGFAMDIALSGSNTASAAINLELRPFNPVVFVGNTVDVGLYAVSDTSMAQTSAGMEIILNWNTSFMQMVTADPTGATPLLASGFLPDSHGLNASISDGDAMWIGLAPFSGPVLATPTGTLLSTLRFLAISPTLATPVDIPALGGIPIGPTIVYDGEVPNLDVTGTLSGTSITILVPAPGALACFGVMLMTGRHRSRSEG